MVGYWLRCYFVVGVACDCVGFAYLGGLGFREFGVCYLLGLMLGLLGCSLRGVFGGLAWVGYRGCSAP